MAGVSIDIDNASATDTILSVKQRVYELDHKLHIRRQRLVYPPGRFGMDSISDDETLGGADFARDGSAKLDVLLVDLTAEDSYTLGRSVRLMLVTDLLSIILNISTRFIASLVLLPVGIFRAEC